MHMKYYLLLKAWIFFFISNTNMNEYDHTFSCMHVNMLDAGKKSDKTFIKPIDYINLVLICLTIINHFNDLLDIDIFSSPIIIMNWHMDTQEWIAPIHIYDLKYLTNIFHIILTNSYNS